MPGEKSLAYSTLAQVIEYLEPGVLKEYLPEVLQQVMKETETRRPGHQETLTVLNAITRKFKLDILEYIDIQVLIDCVLLGGLSSQSLLFLE